MKKLISLLGFFVLFPLNVFASSTGMPWEGPLNTVLSSISGPVTKVISVVAIIICGFGFAFSERGNWMRSAFGVAVGIAIAVGASSLVMNLFGFSGGLGF